MSYWRLLLPKTACFFVMKDVCLHECLGFDPSVICSRWCLCNGWGSCFLKATMTGERKDTVHAPLLVMKSGKHSFLYLASLFSAASIGLLILNYFLLRLQTTLVILHLALVLPICHNRGCPAPANLESKQLLLGCVV